MFHLYMYNNLHFRKLRCPKLKVGFVLEMAPKNRKQQKLTIKPDIQQTSWIVGLNRMKLNTAGELFVHRSLVHIYHKMYHCVVHVQVTIVYCM